MNFNYTSYPNQVIFGKGKIAELPDILKGYSKVMAMGEDPLGFKYSKSERCLRSGQTVLF